MYHHTIAELNSKNLAPGIDIKPLNGKKGSMVFFYLAPGTDIPEHTHPHEQIGTVLKGSLELTIGDEKKVVKAGDAWCIPSDVAHKAHCLDAATEVLEFFAPVREDYA
ncbi:MAG: cupin domain-containing protein [Deltaproteobacteria bacterium]|jgi:quercetin dioxygenase-like cupin family protein|nr:cupin domain-containing protein [Deltaproteobacteria bacterium]